MNIKKKLLPPLLIFLYLMLQGATFNIVPASSANIINISFQGFTLPQYGFLYVTLGIGGTIGSFLTLIFGESKGSYKLLMLSILCFLITYFLLGTVLISLFFPLVNLFFFLLVHFFTGLGMGLSFPLLFTMIIAKFSKKKGAALTFFMAATAFGGLVETYFFLSGYIVAMLFVCALLFLLLFFLFDLFAEFPEAVDKDTHPLHLQGIWNLRLNIFLVAVLDALFMTWPLLYLLHKDAQALEATNIRMAGLSLFLLSRLFYSLLLTKIPFRKISIIATFLFFLFTLTFMFFDANPYVLFGGFSFFYSPLYPFVMTAGIKNNPLRSTRIISELSGIFMLSYGLATLILGIFSTINIFFPLAATFALLICIFHKKWVQGYA